VYVLQRRNIRRGHHTVAHSVQPCACLKLFQNACPLLCDHDTPENHHNLVADDHQLHCCLQLLCFLYLTLLKVIMTAMQISATTQKVAKLFSKRP